ncbi:MAG: diguanylate cyclase (GGDEF)-like protein/PAS domain S-box-containing protein [Candidatus Azotimanducaceae bacterium]|jgi:diguanylate cyclase (GGDEF)-like protein/PAS domain S-box-containing protein
MDLPIGIAAAPQPGDRWSFHVLAGSITDSVVIWSAWRDDTGDIVDFVYEFVNEAAVQTIGIASSDLVGHRLRDVAAVYREPGVFDRYRNVALTGQSDLIEIPWIDDGNVVGAFGVSVSVMGDGIVSVGRSVTKRLEAEGELARSAKIHRHLAGTNPDLLIRLTADGIVIYSSHPAGSHRKAAELIGMHLADLVHPDDRRIVVDTLESARSNGSTTHADLRMARTPSGDFAWAALSATCVANARARNEFHISIRDIQERRAAEQALAIAERMQRLVLDTLGEVVVLQSAEEGVVSVNHAASELLGLVEAPKVTLEQIGAFADIYEVDGSPLDFDDTPAKRARRSGRAERGRLLELRLPDGSHRWIQVNAVLIDDDDAHSDALEDLNAPPRAVRVLSTIIDLTDRVDADQRADQDHQLLRATFDSVHAGLMAVNADGQIIQVNQRFRDLTRGHHHVGQTLLALTYDYSICDERGVPFEVHERPIVRALAGETVSDLASLLRWPDGFELFILASSSPIYDGDDIVGAVLTIQDVTALRSAEAELRKMATIDQLTGLPNRRAVLAHLDAAIERRSAALNRTAELPNRRVDDAIERQPAVSDQLTVLFLDLDGFKSINDTLGHAAGDELLCAVAQRLTAMMRSGDLVGRMGGDEFVAVLERFSPGHTAELAARIEMEIARPFLLAAGIATIGCSIGQAVHTTSHTTDSMLAAADVEMYLTKHARSDDKHD